MLNTIAVVLFYLGISIIPQFLYFEISFLIREKNNKPKLYESIIVGFILGFTALQFLLYGRHGEAGLGVIASSHIVFIFFIITGLPVGVIYKWRKKSFFHLSKKAKKSKINEL
jgi:hypothetical protein